MPSPPATGPRHLRGFSNVHAYLRDTLGMPVGLRAIKRATHEGELPHLEIAGRHYFAPEDIDDWVVSLKVGGPS
ncbi:hypothetical protein AXK56_09195 [Tsukamurella pulmonis]|uniref:Helix-turn-helix domain-containing protein n=1 Tax=Tsukamurella pulmonis TaxID=47312 RepID=A0A1H1BN69_9ACTN|nr:DNA-binding protein [Tsukamurella pulmonis]KXO90272.1 hypothetical protein AXK56_09195 [Tsukamurella pulmonis]SDQ53319.1 hypothetical protein SAMN04489765_0773 [Tsukamurella pulmonis]SUP24872.1 Uncharacterised protein [Tsukamurella pulmonis]